MVNIILKTANLHIVYFNVQCIYEFDTLCGIAFNLGFHTFYNISDYHIESIELLLLVINNRDLSSEIIQTSYIGKY